MQTVTTAHATRKPRGLFKTILLSVAGLFTAFIALCVVLTIVDPPDPKVVAQQQAAEKQAVAVQANLIGAYAGQWTGQDGTTITIRGDGSADFNMGNASVTGGSAHFGVRTDGSAETLKLKGLFGISREWTITALPEQTAENHTEMTLNQVVYRRTSGFDAPVQTREGN